MPAGIAEPCFRAELLVALRTRLSLRRPALVAELGQGPIVVPATEALHEVLASARISQCTRGGINRTTWVVVP
jgi:hypothetical protein